MARRVIIAVFLLAAIIVAVRLALVAREFDTVVTAPNSRRRATITPTCALSCGACRRAATFTPICPAPSMPNGSSPGRHRKISAPILRTCCMSKPQCELPGDVSAADAMHDQKLYDQLVNAFSTRSFVPTVAVPTDHDKFFAAFDKFGAASGSRFVDMTLDQLRDYHSENVQYVEFMVSFSCSERPRQVHQGDGRTRPTMPAGSRRCKRTVSTNASRRSATDLVASIGKIRTELGCDPAADAAGLRSVTFRYIAQLLRNTTPDDVFVQTAIAAALIRAEPRVVALNLVQSEDNLVARRDYTRHMEIVGFLASDVKVALHAGELWLGHVPPPDLTFHIRQAIEIADARRIGHGVDLAFERDVEGLLAEMRQRPVAVEINLSSNDIILGVRGKDHPLATYLAAGVPVVLSTDDAGVSRIDMTNEYFRAVARPGARLPRR